METAVAGVAEIAQARRGMARDHGGDRGAQRHDVRARRRHVEAHHHSGRPQSVADRVAEPPCDVGGHGPAVAHELAGGGERGEQVVVDVVVAGELHEQHDGRVVTRERIVPVVAVREAGEERVSRHELER